jgi:1-acyl-sn-glycerol-3-phosphate acyltransferase
VSDQDRRVSDGPPWAWRLVVGAVIGFLRELFGWRVRARRPSTVPRPDQPLVVVFNHTSNVDAFLVVDLVWRGLGHWCQPLAKTEIFDVPVLGYLARRAGAIPVTRTEGAGREVAYTAAVERLRAGGTVMVAPEGTVTHDGSLLPLRHGAARLALEAGVDVLVVTQFGAQRGFSPVQRVPERDVVVTMAFDLLTPWEDEDAASLTGRIAATMLDRSEELQERYPQADPSARWWPPYAAPASPSVVARENLERYRHSMSEAVANARERMTRYAEEHELEERLAQARERVSRLAEEHHVEERLAEARERARAAAEELAARSRERAELLSEQARQTAGLARERAEQLAEQARERAEELADQARHRFDELTDPQRDRGGSPDEDDGPGSDPEHPDPPGRQG